MPTPSGITGVLLACPLFQHLEAELTERVAPHFRRATFRAGQEIFHAGDAGDALHVIGSGRVKIVVDGPRGGEVILTTLGPGAHFGEIALFTGDPRSATVCALENTTTWKLDRAGFRELIEGQPALEQYFNGVVANASIRTFLKRSTVLTHATPEALRDFMAALEPVALEPGQVLFREGEPATHFYIVREGRVRLVRGSSDEEQTVGTPGPGDHFGDMGIASGSPRAATAVAAEPTRLFALAAADFKRILGGEQAVRRELEQRVASFRKAMRADVPLDREAPSRPAPTRGPRPAAGSVRGRLGFARTPYLEQAEELDCGACCLSMVSTFYGARSALAPLRDLVNVTKEGATLLSIAQAAEQIGFSAWPESRLPVDGLAGAQLPAIAQWEGSHWVVVYRAEADLFVIADPGIGIRHLSRAEFAAGYTDEAVVLVPAGPIRKLAGAGIGFQYFSPLFRPFLPVLWEIFLCALLLTAFGLAVPVFTSTVVDSVMVKGSTSMLVIMLVGMLIVNTCQLWTRSLETYLTLYVSSRIDVGLVVKFYRHVLRLPTRYFDVRKVGDILARFGENENVRELFTGTPLAAVLNMITVALYLTLMSFFNLKLTLALLAYIPLYVLVMMVAAPIMRRLAAECFARHSLASGFLIESVTGIQTVKANAIEQPIRWRWQNTFIDASARNLKRELGDGGLEISSGFIESLSSATLLYFGALQVMSNQLTVGQLMAFYAMIGMVMGPIGTLLGMWDEIQRGLMGLERISEVLAFEQEQPPEVKARAKVLPPFQGHLVFDRVTFSYDPKGGRKHLDDVTFEAKPGEMIAVVGRSGAGKTTLASVLLRMRDPMSGRVLIDGHDLAEAELESLRRQIGVVMQENFLFAGTIRDNICPDDPNAPMDRIIHAATLAGAHDFISQLPMGYDTVIGERGAGLSGGQRQRVAIARCLYRDPRVLIFDEATSALDTESEKIIQRNMAKFLHGRTSIVIAHRLSTIRAADKILVMDTGRVVEMGTHQELMALKGIYYCLNTQSVRED